MLSIGAPKHQVGVDNKKEWIKEAKEYGYEVSRKSMKEKTIIFNRI